MVGSSGTYVNVVQAALSEARIFVNVSAHPLPACGSKTCEQIWRQSIASVTQGGYNPQLRLGEIPT